MFCNKCGKEISYEAQFCTSCQEEQNTITQAEASKQEASTKFKPITCPKCKGTNFAVITEKHLGIGLRIFEVVMLVFAIWILLIAGFRSLQYPDSETSTLLSFPLLIYAFIVIIRIIHESKTHVQCVCRDCGKTWLHKDEEIF